MAKIDPSKKEIRACRICGTEFLIYKSQHRVLCSYECFRKDASIRVSARNISLEHRDKNLSVLANNRLTPYWTGRERPLETMIKQSKSMLGKNKGEANGNWKGGKGSLRHKIAVSSKYKWWRRSIFVRDGYTCCECHTVGGKLHVHHIKSVKQIIEEHRIKTIRRAYTCKELWSINNGITVCQICHQLKHPNVHVLKNCPKYPYKRERIKNGNPEPVRTEA